jgi:hypothetical protein
VRTAHEYSRWHLDFSRVMTNDDEHVRPGVEASVAIVAVMQLCNVTYLGIENTAIDTLGAKGGDAQVCGTVCVRAYLCVYTCA